MVIEEMTTGSTKYRLPRLIASDCLESGVLEFRASYLNDLLVNSPQALAQRVEVHIIKDAETRAPWLIPLIIR